MIVGAYVKDPDEVLDYTIDWAAAIPSDTIASSTWVVPAGITQASPSPSYTTTATTIWLSGGTAGTVYDVVNRITTSGGRTLERALQIRVEYS